VREDVGVGVERERSDLSASLHETCRA
jgi:hypothetical protein